MRARNLTIGLLAAAACGLLASHAVPQDQDPAEMAKMMELWQKFYTPGEQHQALGKLVGKWEVESRVRMAPDAPPMTSKGEAEFRWLMPGRWLAQDYKGAMMGMPYQGFGVLGYDNFKKKYVQVWVDNMSTAMLVGEGVVVDPEGNVQVLYGPMDEFLTGEHDKTVKYVTRWEGDDQFVYEIWDLGIGPDGAVVIELTYTRRK